MIVDINEGKVQSFTLSELTGIKSTEEVLDVITFDDKLYVLTTEACHIYKAELGQYFTQELK